MAQTRTYFAYGENMNVNRLNKWLSQRGGRPDGIVSAQRAVLDGYRLVFNVLGGFPRRAGIANLKQNPKGKVEGVLMQINNAAEGLIQKKEGIPGRAKRIEVSVTGDQDKKYEGVSAYVTAQPDGKTHLPARGYVDLMLQAAKDFEFSKDYTKKLQNIKTAD